MKIWWKINDALWALYDKLEGYIKYNVIGVIGAAINFSLLWLLTDIGHIWYLLSATIAIFIAASNNYILNYHWTFKKRKHEISNMWIGWLKFLLSIGITESLYLLIIYLLTSKAGMYYLLSAFIALSLTTVIRYLVASKWIWKSKLQYEQD